MLTRHTQRGFTLIELMVTLTIIGMMVAMVMPSFSTMIQNGRLASTAKSYMAGLQLARTEAIRTNAPVEFVMTNTPVASGIATAAVPSTTGQNWVVRAVDTSASTPYTLIEAKSGLEGSGQAGSAAVQVTGIASGAAFGGKVGFDGFGAASMNVTLKVLSPVGACQPAGPMRCQNVVVQPGGRISTCDPSAASAVRDSRACQ